jgi:8-oxo-dGTP pyrophosphatase MutT (NUDIX family)
MWVENAPNVPTEQIAMVSVAITDAKGRVLVVRRSKREKTRPGEWECPGGHREQGESVEQAGKREVKEELGLNVRIDNSRREYFTLRDGRYGVLVKAECVSDPEAIRLVGHDKYVWMDPEDTDYLEPTPLDFAESVRALFDVGEKKMVASRKKDKAPAFLQLPNRRQARVVRQPRIAHADPEQTAKEVQAMYSVIGIPAWEAMFVYQNSSGPAHGNPDWSQNEQEDSVPTTLQAVTGVLPQSFGNNEYQEPLYHTILEALQDRCLHEQCECSCPSAHEAFLRLENPREMGTFLDVIKGAGLIAAPLKGRAMIYVTRPRVAYIVKEGKEFTVKGKNGRSFGTYPTREEAQKRLDQVEMFKHMDKSKKKKSRKKRKANGIDLTVKADPSKARAQNPVVNTSQSPVDKAIQQQTPPGTTVQQDPANPENKNIHLDPPPGTSPAELQRQLNQITQALAQAQGGTAVANLKARMRRAKTELEDRYCAKDWFRGVTFLPHQGRVALAIKTVPEGAVGEKLPPIFSGMAVFVMRMKRPHSDIRPLLRN